MIEFRQKGDFSKLTRYLEKAKEVVKLGDLDRYGRAGVAALASATPVASGVTANSWYYKITDKTDQQRSLFTIQTFKMGSQLLLFYSMVTELGMAVG